MATATKPPVAERKAEAARLLGSEPALTNRQIAERSGLSRSAVARMRPAPAVIEPGHYGRRTSVSSKVPALVASAARINLDDRRQLAALRRLRQAWQEEAWDYFYEVGEINYTVNFDANLKSKLRLFAAVRPEASAAPIPVDSPKSGVDKSLADLCNATLERLRSPQGGQSAIIRDAAVNFDVAGECWLHGHQDTDTGEEEWHIRSVSEMVSTNEAFGLRRAPGVAPTPIDGDDVVVRMWQRDPRYTDLATCAMRSVLAEAEALLLLSREIRATAKSRLSNGVLLLPSELSFGSADPTRDLGDGEEAEDPFEMELQESMITPIQEEGSAAAVVPMVIRGPAEYLKDVRHLVLDRSLDPVLDQRIEGRIIRIARGLNMPVEVTTGLMATTFANASQIKQSEFEDHVEPAATLMCDALTAGYFQPALEAAGLERDVWQDIFVWFDAEALIVHPDQAEQATEAHKDGVISDEARRRYVGFTEDDAPTDEEMIRRLIFHATRLDPFVLSQMIKDSGLAPELLIAMPPGGIMGEPDTYPTKPPAEGPATAEAPPGEAPGEEGAPPPPADGKDAKPDEAGKPEAPQDATKAKAASAIVTGPWHPSMSVTGGNGHGLSAQGYTPIQMWPLAPNLPIVAAAKPRADAWRRLGVRLMSIDRDLRTRIQMALDRSMRQALKAAGNRVKSRIQRDKLTGAVNRLAASTRAEGLCAACGPTLVAATGLTDTDLIAGAFDGVLPDVATWMNAAFERALSEVAKLAGPMAEAKRTELEQRHQANVKLAVESLQTNMTALLANRLYDPTPRQAAQGESDATVAVPVSIVRVALAIAGGGKPSGGRQLTAAAAWIEIPGPVTDQGGGPVGGIATGPDIMGEVDGASGGVEGYEWDYGAAIRQPFEPHEALDGTSFVNFDDDVLTNDEGWPDTDYYFPGDHEGCFPAGTVVSGPEAAAATLRDWQGEMVEVALASGQFLTATPNHPVLTAHGWVALGELVEGDEVVRCVDTEGITGLVPNHHQVPARIEDVAGALGVHRGMLTAGVEVAAENFHGDGLGSQVAVVAADRQLWDGLNAALGQPDRQLPLSLAHPGFGRMLATESGAEESIVAVGSAPLRLESVGGHGPAPLGCPGGEDQGASLAAGADTHTPLHQPLGDGDAVDAQALGQGLDRLTGFIAADKVIDVKRYAFHGPVYNLDTRVGWYIAGSTIVANCCCDITPIVLSPDEAGGETPDGEIPEDLDVAQPEEEPEPAMAEFPGMEGMTIKDASAWMSENWPRLTDAEGNVDKAASINLTGLKREVADRVGPALVDLANRYPETAQILNFVGATADKNPFYAYKMPATPKGAIAYEVNLAKRGSAEAANLAIRTTKTMNEIDELARMGDIGWTAVGSPEGVIRHEFGHAYEDYLKSTGFTTNQIHSAVDDALKPLMDPTVPATRARYDVIRDGLSRYATYNTNETIAEAFSEVTTAEVEGTTARPVAQAIMDALRGLGS